MQNNRLLKNTFILILGGFITKILGFIIKILYTRYLKEDGVSLISLIFPTYSLILSITTFALPLAVTKFTAENKDRKSKIIFNSIYVSLLMSFILILFIFIFSNYFSNNILHDNRCGFLLKIMCTTLPFISVTSIIKAYFFGKENVTPVIISNVSEEITKLILIILFLPKMINKGILYGTSFYLLINLICEITSFIILYLFLPKKINIKKLDYKYDNKILNKLFKISIPTLSGRLIGNIGYFFEPIIITNLLLYKGFNASFIRLNYGYFQGYVIALLTIPSFFLSALSNSIIPTISKYKINKNFKQIKRIIKKIILIIFFLGIIYALILYLFGKNIMNTLYKTTSGYNYLKILLPFFVLFYLEVPLISVLQSLDQEKKLFKITALGTIIKYLSLVFLILLNNGFMSIIYSEIINIIFVITLCIYYLKKYFSYFSR